MSCRRSRRKRPGQGTAWAERDTGMWLGGVFRKHSILKIERETELGPSRVQPMASSMRDCKDLVFILWRTEKQPRAVWTKWAAYLIYIRAVNHWAGEMRKGDLWHGDPTEMPAEMGVLAFRIWWQRLCNSQWTEWGKKDKVRAYVVR